MTDITLSVTITRTLLGLTLLELNDHENFYAAPSSPGPVTWARQSVSAPHVDSEFDVAMRRNRVSEECIFEVRGESQADLATNISTIIEAFAQANFTLTTTFGGTTAYSWACSAADYQVIWSGPRMVAEQVQVRFTVPRSPVPVAGVF